MKKIIVLTITFTLISVGLLSGCIQNNNCGWKKSTDPEDVKNFLNGEGSYE